MANYTSVIIGGPDSMETHSPSGSPGSGRLTGIPTQGVLNDLATSQPDNMRVTLGAADGDSMRVERVQSVMAPTSSGLPGSLGTIQDQFGRPVGDLTTMDLKANTIQVGGSRCTIDIALQQGLLTRDGAGNLVETPALQAVNSRHLSKPEAGPKVDLIASHRPTLNEFHQRVGFSQTSAFISQAIHATVNGRDIEGLAADFAESTRAKPGTVKAWAQEYMNDLANRGVDQAAKLGKVDRGQLAKFVEGLPPDNQSRLESGLVT